MKLEGIDQLGANMRKALLTHTEAEVRKVMRRGATLIVDAARSKAPVESGLLRDSIKILPKFRGDPMGVYVGPIVKRKRSVRTGKKGEGRTQKEQPFYAAMVEYGTDPHNLGYKGKYVSGKGADHPGARKQPYMRPAFDTQGQAALNAAMDDITKLIESKVK